jgi:di/tricarboxylate transporter
MLGGVCTVVGTSTNVVVSGELERLGEPAYGLFETGLVGLPCLVLGMAYLLFVAPRLLARRGAQGPADEYAVRSFLGEVVVAEGSSWVGRSLAGLRPRDRGVEVLGVVRGGGDVQPIAPEDEFRVGDVVVVKAAPAELLALASADGLRTIADDSQVDRAAHELVFVEVMVSPSSTLVGHTLKEARFRQRFRAVALAIYRHGVALHAKVGRVRLHVGDVLLVQGPAPEVEALADSPHLILLDSGTHHRPRRRDRGLALAVFGVFLLVGGLTGQFAAAALLGAVLMVGLKCITPEEAYAFTGWRVLVIVGGMLALAEAMVQTQAAGWLAHAVLHLAGATGLTGVLALFFLLTIALTQGMSNQAAALVVLPVALAAAAEAGLPARCLAMTITVAASCAFLTPLEPASVLVYGPGRYRFRDFAIVGAPLTLIVLAVTLVVVPAVWG